MIEALLLAIGLAMDASAVSAARGANVRSLASRDFLLLPLLFGAFQAGMAALGWQGASWSMRYIDTWDHWLAFGLLVLIGGKMIREGIWGGDDDSESTAGGLATDVSLAVATSLDAAAAGVSLPSVPAPAGVSLALIGVVTAALSAGAFVLGARVGDRLGRPATALGGIVLIAIAVRLLWVALA